MVKLTLKQREGLVGAILGFVDGNHGNPGINDMIPALKGLCERLTHNPCERDLEIATLFRWLPNTHEETDTLLGHQLLAWHKLGALDSEKPCSDMVGLLRYKLLGSSKEE